MRCWLSSSSGAVGDAMAAHGRRDIPPKIDARPQLPVLFALRGVLGGYFFHLVVTGCYGRPYVRLQAPDFLRQLPQVVGVAVGPLGFRGVKELAQVNPDFTLAKL